MQTFGHAPHVPEFKEAIEKWLSANKLKGKAMLFATSRWCLVLCADSQPHNWIVFWSPYVHGRLTSFYDNIIRFYDWESIPTKNRKPLAAMLSLWESSK
jgi:hypothetical protein